MIQNSEMARIEHGRKLWAQLPILPQEVYLKKFVAEQSLAQIELNYNEADEEVKLWERRSKFSIFFVLLLCVAYIIISAFQATRIVNPGYVVIVPVVVVAFLAIIITDNKIAKASRRRKVAFERLDAVYRLVIDYLRPLTLEDSSLIINEDAQRILLESLAMKVIHAEEQYYHFTSHFQPNGPIVANTILAKTIVLTGTTWEQAKDAYDVCVKRIIELTGRKPDNGEIFAAAKELRARVSEQIVLNRFFENEIDKMSADSFDRTDFGGAD